MFPDHKNIQRSFYHFSFLKDIKIHGIYLNSIGGYLNQYPFANDPHYHDFYTILFISGGSGSLTVCGEKIVMENDSVILIAPNQLHSFRGLDTTNGLIFFFCQDFYVEEFSFVRLLNVFSYISPGENGQCGPGIILTDSEVKPLNEIIESIRKEYSSCVHPFSSAVIIRSFLNILLLRLGYIFESKTGNTSKNESSIVYSLSNFIESNYIREHKTGFYSEAFNISEKHLNDICNRNFKCGLKKILHDRLMQESRRLLVSTELSVAEISYKLNFEDNSYFNKVFRKSTGLTPKKFRDLHKKLLP